VLQSPGSVTVADRISIAGGAGVSKSLTKEGETYFGYPAKEAGKHGGSKGHFGNYRSCCFTIREWKSRIQMLEKKSRSWRDGNRAF